MLTPLKLTGRAFVITGAASGIGKATALLISKYGARLILVDINKDGLEEVASQCKSDVTTLILDLTKPEEIKNKLKEKIKDFGKINGFVHCAGIPYVAPLSAINADKANKLFQLNTYAAIELAKVCSSKFCYSGTNGSFVLISSVYGIVGSPANVVYAMSKGGIISITRALSMELVSKGIRVNCIAPGFIKTPMMDDVSDSFDNNYLEHLNSLHPMGLGEASDIANGILFLLSDMSKWITGIVLSIDGGFTAK